MGRNTSNVLNTDITLEIARGTVPGMDSLTKFGLNATVGTTEATIWDAGGIIPWLATASILDIQSTDINDNSTGTGARTMLISGLDGNYDEISETVILNGTTTVNTINSFLRIHTMVIMTAGSQAKAIGIITAEVSSVVYGQLDDGNNQSLMCTYTIPAGKTGYILYGKASIGKGSDATIRFKGRPEGGVFNLQHSFYLYQNDYDYVFQTPLQIGEKTDLMVSGQTSTGTAAISAAFNIILIDN